MFVRPSFSCRILPAAISACFLAPLHAQTNPSGEPSASASAPATLLAPVSVNARGGDQKPSEGGGSYAVRKNKGATGLSLDQKETPQSVSVVTRAQMEDFKSTTANKVLEGVTGVTVQRYEEDRTYYTARGFDITNFQTDGMGLPMAFGLVEGDMDTAIYDRVEVIRGANGLMSATGNPSATVNFVRKRPTKDFQASGSLTYGSWSTKRIEGDVSGSLVESGKIRGRLIAGGEDGDSYLDRYHKRKAFLSAIVEADLDPATTLTAGYSYQNNRPTGSMWGGLPLYYQDGTQAEYARSASTSMNWSYWKTKSQTAFAEARHVFDSGWQATATLTRRENEQDSHLFYLYGQPDRDTGLGLYSYPSNYTLKGSQNQMDVRASGPFQLFGREHEALVGVSYARSVMKEFSGYGNDIGTALPSLSNWNADYPEPSYDASSNGSDYWMRQRSLFAATKIQAADKLKLILGANNTRITSAGNNYGADFGRENSATSPYAGVVYDITPVVSAYSSFTSIFTAQNQQGVSGSRLDPAKGYNTEAGLKFASPDGLLNASLAVFRSRQDNLAEYVETIATRDIYKGVDTYSQGYELEAAGQVLPGVQLSAGYMALSIRDGAGDVTRTYMPNHTFNTALKWQITAPLKVGAKLRWQGDTHSDVSDSIKVRQDAYAILDLMAGYAFTKNLSADLNIYNVGDKKYWNSVRWTQGYYGAGRNASLSLNWKY